MYNRENRQIIIKPDIIYMILCRYDVIQYRTHDGCLDHNMLRDGGTCQHNSLDFIYTSGSHNDILNGMMCFYGLRLNNDMLLKMSLSVVLISFKTEDQRNPEPRGL